jgi:flagellar hook-associated protein FlgK
LNVSDQTVKEGLQNMSSSISFISESLWKLKNDENQEISDRTLESISFMGNIGYDAYLW